MPPYDSVDEFSRALRDFERGDRARVIGDVRGRAFAADRERRGCAPGVDELRRQLRDADMRYYEAVVARKRRRPARASARVPAMALGIAAGLAMITAGEALHAWRQSRPAAPPSVAAHDRTAATPAPAESRTPATVQSAPELRATGGESAAVSTEAGRPRTADSALFDPDLRVVTVADSGARSRDVRVSPDGRYLAFDSNRDGQRGVYVSMRDGTEVRRVSGEGFAERPAWAPDSRRLTFVKAEPGRSGVRNLWLAAVDSRLLKRLTHYQAGRVQDASWFKDGRHLCYAWGDRLVVLDSSTGTTRDYASPVAGRNVASAAVSPGGHRVMFQVARNGAWLLDLRDGSMRRAIRDPTASAFAWAPDGRRVAFHSARDGAWDVWVAPPSAPGRP